jgi:NADH-quinone oxidoreductase subunit G
VRFTSEISQTHQLTMVQRGNQNYPITAQSETFDDPYSLNTVDICPVGALTSRDHRFQARVWEMNYTPTICTGCAKGCNADVWVRDNLVMRLTPRKNPQVNGHWLCDEGRLDYKKYNHNRTSGMYNAGMPISWDKGIEALAALVSEHTGHLLWVGSAYASVETLYVLRALRDKIAPESPLYYIPHIQAGWGDRLLRRDDRTPNRKAADALGYLPIELTDLIQRLDGAPDTFLYWVEDDPALQEVLPRLPSRVAIVAHTYNRSPLPERLTYEIAASTHLEGFATFVNEDGIAQTVQPARQWQQMKPTDWFYLPKSRLDAAGQAVDRWRNPAHIPDCLPTYQLLIGLADKLKKPLALPTDHLSLWEKLKATLPFMQSAVYAPLKRKEIFRHDQLTFAIKV